MRRNPTIQTRAICHSYLILIPSRDFYYKNIPATALCRERIQPAGNALRTYFSNSQSSPRDRESLVSMCIVGIPKEKGFDEVGTLGEQTGTKSLGGVTPGSVGSGKWLVMTFKSFDGEPCYPSTLKMPSSSWYNTSSGNETHGTTDTISTHA